MDQHERLAARSNNFTLDGAIINNQYGTARIRSPEILWCGWHQEYKVITTFSAEYGLTTGSQMVIVSKAQQSLARDVFEYSATTRMPAIFEARLHCWASASGTVQTQQLRRRLRRTDPQRQDVFYWCD